MYCNLHFNVSQIQMARAEKQYMIDHLGKNYLDCISNVAHVGHCHPQIVAAAQTQFSKLATGQGLISEKSSYFIKKLVDSLPDALNICYLVNSGSEANDLALRLARTYTKKYDVIVYDDSYHGNLSSLIDISPKIFKKMGYPQKDFVHMLPVPDTYKGLYTENDSLACEKYICSAKKMLTDLFGEEHKLACFIAEPVIVNCGIIVPPKPYLKAVYDAVRELGGVCISDEVQTGLGRLGEHMWAFQYFGVIPDIVTIGKPLGNGYPMAAVITTNEIADSLGEYYSTFGGNPVACAIGRAVFEIIENEKLMASGKSVGKTLLEGLKQLQSQYECVGDVRGMGLCIGIEIVVDKTSKKPNPIAAENIVFMLKESHQIIAQAQGPNLSVITITPPMCFTQQNARTFVSALDQVLSTTPSMNEQFISTTRVSNSLFGHSSTVITSEALQEMETLEPWKKKPKLSYGDVD